MPQMTLISFEPSTALSLHHYHLYPTTLPHQLRIVLYVIFPASKSTSVVSLNCVVRLFPDTGWTIVS